KVSGEQTKSGVRPEGVQELARAIASLPRISLRGLMAIPEDTEDFARQRSQFRELRQLKDDLAHRGFALDTLSMGMSHDLEAAVMEGATIVRVGAAIFGERRRRDS
ncbi:MAG TPA: alanine racemase, partial [Burkholderiales bacterium]|nr:alanine racemase [Burkholderiales bacterium]